MAIAAAVSRMFSKDAPPLPTYDELVEAEDGELEDDEDNDAKFKKWMGMPK